MDPDGDSRPLDDTELIELGAALGAVDATHDVEFVDGLFCALIAGPTPVAAVRWLPLLFGEAHAPARDAERIIELLRRHWNDVASRLQLPREALNEDSFYLPLVLDREGEDAPQQGQRWARGFAAGMGLAGEDAWAALLEDEAKAQWLAPIVLLGRDDAPADREALSQALPASAYRIHRFWQARSHASRRRGERVGRNDPCPCGSGKKYKKCCGAGAPTLH